MAGRFNRVLFALSLPAIIAIVSLYWLRKRKKGQIADSGRSRPSETHDLDSRRSSSQESESERELLSKCDKQSASENKTRQDIDLNTKENAGEGRASKMQLRDGNNRTTSGTPGSGSESKCLTQSLEKIVKNSSMVVEVEVNEVVRLKIANDGRESADIVDADQPQLVRVAAKEGTSKGSGLSDSDYPVQRVIINESRGSSSSSKNVTSAYESNCGMSSRESSTCSSLVLGEDKNRLNAQENSHNEDTSLSRSNETSHSSLNMLRICSLPDESLPKDGPHFPVNKSTLVLENNAEAPKGFTGNAQSVDPFSANGSQTRREPSDDFTLSGCVASESSCKIVENSADSPSNCGFSDINSEGSSDSGKGSSDIPVNPLETLSVAMNGNPVIIYQFELPQDFCGRLIGRFGHFVNLIRDESNATVIVNNHPYTANVKICSIEGTRSEIKCALHLIRKRFPNSLFPEVTLQQINAISPWDRVSGSVPVPQSCQLQLPEGVSCDVIMSSLVNAGHFFLQQPTHPTYPSLSRLDQFMTSTYSQVETPLVPNPTVGVICSVPIMGGWYRGMVVAMNEKEDCEVKFVDYGGYSRLPVSSLRQIRVDFMTLPFQASECYLAGVEPSSENGWTTQANALFEELAQGQILQAVIVGFAENGVPFVHLYKVQGVSNIFINQELIDRGFAQRVESDA